MGKQVYTGRYTVENDQDIIVFIIGMRINKRYAIHKWGPVFSAMPGMIKELYENQEKLGFLSVETYFGLRTTLMVQYWRSTEDLLSYAKGEKHVTAWRNFNKKMADNDAVGFYHETYQIKSGHYESIYRNMPKFGLGKAIRHIPAGSQHHSARKRLQSAQSK
ncbi:DUF4188 domain-containing protein [Gracilibacillus phocaeensis]|uniref:DUF4188 domain-containing protein n=1 Tax=Gracilibacillus phocaeensis TaxID=2042304 RepID=UPI001032376B|nr:DUF4188 domain-containing protein [Gracilibacillus phocaeensis]